jgi:hypothetical protein
MDQAVGHIQQHYENWYQQAGQQIISVQPGQQQFSQQVAARVEAGSSSEVAKLRALMSGQAPASSAPNSSAGHRDGARPNSGPTPGQQVTRPERGPNQPRSSQRD